jgi:GNAT superfamily N-acetyltransferase
VDAVDSEPSREESGQGAGQMVGQPDGQAKGHPAAPADAPQDAPACVPTFRRATRADAPRIIAMLADDAIGATRESYADPLPDVYWEAFAQIDADPRQYLVVAEIDGRVVGTLQLTFIPYLTHRGSSRALIEGVRVDSNQRGGGVGRLMVAWAIEEARRHGCQMLQLTTDKRRTEAQRFYESLGFVSTHEGMKLSL